MLACSKMSQLDPLSEEAPQRSWLHCVSDFGCHSKCLYLAQRKFRLVSLVPSDLSDNLPWTVPCALRPHQKWPVFPGSSLLEYHGDQRGRSLPLRLMSNYRSLCLALPGQFHWCYSVWIHGLKHSPSELTQKGSWVTPHLPNADAL